MPGYDERAEFIKQKSYCIGESSDKNGQYNVT